MLGIKPSADRCTAVESFIDALYDRMLLLDGAMGTQIQNLAPKAGDFPDGRDGFNDGLSVTRPEWIRGIHRAYLEAGADCIETNTFGSNRIKLDEYGFGDQTISFNRTAAEMAVDVCSRYGDRYVLGSMGPTGYLPSSVDPDLGGMPLDDISGAFDLQAEGLVLGGVDALLIETSQDILEVKLAIEGIQKAMGRVGRTVPIIANVTLDQYGKMLLGTPVDAAYTTLRDMGISVFGLNCSTGPQEMIPSIRWLDSEGEHPILVVPNAGMPENAGGRAVYKMRPDAMSGIMDGIASKYGSVRIMGGCCGTNPDHIKLLRQIVDRHRRPPAGPRRQYA